jgi:hypothetical protein
VLFDLLYGLHQRIFNWGLFAETYDPSQFLLKLNCREEFARFVVAAATHEA